MGLKELLAEFNEAQVVSAVIDRAIEVRKSQRIKIPDALIAATALVYQADLVTRNRSDFEGIDGIVIIDPSSF